MGPWNIKQQRNGAHDVTAKREATNSNARKLTHPLANMSSLSPPPGNPNKKNSKKHGSADSKRCSRKGPSFGLGSRAPTVPQARQPAGNSAVIGHSNIFSFLFRGGEGRWRQRKRQFRPGAYPGIHQRSTAAKGSSWGLQPNGLMPDGLSRLTVRT